MSREEQPFNILAVVDVVLLDIETEVEEELARHVVERIPHNRRGAALRAATEWLTDHPGKEPEASDALTAAVVGVVTVRLAEVQGDWRHTARRGDLFVECPPVPDALDDDAWRTLLAVDAPTDGPRPTSSDASRMAAQDSNAPPFAIDLTGVPLAVIVDHEGVLYLWRDGGRPITRAEQLTIWTHLAARCAALAERLHNEGDE